MSQGLSRQGSSREGFEILFFSILAGVGTGWLGFIGLRTEPIPSILLLSLSGLFFVSSVMIMRPDYWNRFGVPLLFVALGLVTTLLGILVLTDLNSPPLAALTFVGGFAALAYWVRTYLKATRVGKTSDNLR